jgi:hypothetical protein
MYTLHWIPKHSETECVSWCKLWWNLALTKMWENTNWLSICSIGHIGFLMSWTMTYMHNHTTFALSVLCTEKINWTEIMVPFRLWNYYSISYTYKFFAILLMPKKSALHKQLLAMYKTPNFVCMEIFFQTTCKNVHLA